MLSELKKLGKHTIIYGTGVLLGKGIGFFLIPLYTHYLTPSDYGVLELLDLTGYVLSYFFIMGLNEAILRFYPYYNKNKDRNSVISSAIFFTILFDGVLLVVLLSISKYFGQYILGSVKYSFLFQILFINLLLEAIRYLESTTLQAQQRSLFFSSISLISTGLAMSLNIYFIAFLHLGIKGILYSTFLTSFLIASYLGFVILRETGFHFEFNKLKQMLKYCLPFIPSALLMFVFNWSDRYILRIYTDMATVGLYALGYKIGMIVVVLISFPFNLIWRAYIFEAEKRDDAKRTYSRVTTYYFFALFFVGLLIAVLSKEIITIMADPSYLNAYKVIPLITLAMIFMCLDNVAQVGILLKNKTTYLPIASGIAAIVNVCLNFILIPKYSMMGAAIATAISMGLYLAFIYILSQKIYFIPFEIRRIFKILFSSVLIFTLLNFNPLLFKNVFITSVIKSSAATLFFFLILYFLNFFNNEEKEALQVIGHQMTRPFIKGL